MTTRIELIPRKLVVCVNATSNTFSTDGYFFVDFVILELWVNFDQIYCFWAYLDFKLIIGEMSFCLLLFDKLILCYVSPISVRPSVTGICNRQTDGKLQRGAKLMD